MERATVTWRDVLPLRWVAAIFAGTFALAFVLAFVGTLVAGLLR